MIDSTSALDLARHGVAYAPQIERAAQRHGVDPRLLAAVAAQETGGPGSNSGSNIVGDGGHGHGVFQIDDRWHAFARSSAAMDPQANADYAAGMIANLLQRYGNVRQALSAYNAGDPNASGTMTQWQDGSRLDYADSVMRHYALLGGQESQPVQDLSSYASMTLPPPAPATFESHSYRQLAGNDTANPGSIVDADGDDDGDPFDVRMEP
jgi:hypothetical protein